MTPLDLSTWADLIEMLSMEHYEMDQDDEPVSSGDNADE